MTGVAASAVTGRRRRAWRAALLATASVCACLVAGRWSSGGAGRGGRGRGNTAPGILAAATTAAAAVAGAVGRDTFRAGSEERRRDAAEGRRRRAARGGEVVDKEAGGDQAGLSSPTAAGRGAGSPSAPRVHADVGANGNNDGKRRSVDEEGQTLRVTTTTVAGVETEGNASRTRLLRRGKASRRAQSSEGQRGGKGDDDEDGGGGGGPPGEGEDDDGGQEKVVQDVGSDSDSEDDGFGSVGLLAFLVCFGLLFCVMEAAKCYFVVGCWRQRRQQRARRQRAAGGARQMPIASSRVVAPEVPFTGSKDDWVEVVVEGVSFSAETPQDKDVPSATGYAVAGASHALQEAIEHARQLTPGRSYRAVFASPPRPRDQRRDTAASREMSPEISPGPSVSETERGRASPPSAPTAAAADGGRTPCLPI